MNAISTVPQLISAIPALVGFLPECSLVVMTLAAGQIGVVLRIDLSDACAGVDRVAELAAQQDGADAAVAVIVDGDGASCSACASTHQRLVETVREALEERGIMLAGAFVVDSIRTGSRWHCADGCGDQGLLDDPGHDGLFVGAQAGRRIYGSRAELMAVVAPDMGRRGRLEPLMTNVGPSTDAVATAILAARQHREGVDPADQVLATIARATDDPRARDAFYALAVSELAAPMEDLWALLARVLPSRWRVAALAQLAFSAYVRGDGVVAGVAVDEAVGEGINHPMVELLGTALDHAVPPEKVRALVIGRAA
ncbi:hypothetical protein E3G68_005343 [Mycobacteroides abscessus]|uniref:DUF4192 family protein n=1 Tax=Mycobacteroides abscessus TaxID=36809 RepID=UPI001878CD4E|nr:hypothetical protein [Mycobacteroides abscessus]